MTRQDKEKALVMRENGESYQFIAYKFGVSRQRIHQILNYNLKNRTASACIYKGLSKVIYDKKLNVGQLNQVSGLNIDRATLGRRLKGVSDFKISEIRKLLEFTGMTFEECFAEKETPGAATPRESSK